MSAKESVGGPKKGEKEKNAGQSLRRAWFFNGGKGLRRLKRGKLREDEHHVRLGPFYIGLYQRCGLVPSDTGCVGHYATS